MGDDIREGLPSPPGVTPNYEDPENISWMVLAAIGATLPLAIVACVLRLYTSKRIVGRWHVDDGELRGPARVSVPSKLLTSTV